MVNVDKLKIAMIQRHIDNKTLASKCGIEYKNLLRKLRENDDWTVLQAQAVADALELTRDERVEIFMERK